MILDLLTHAFEKRIGELLRDDAHQAAARLAIVPTTVTSKDQLRAVAPFGPSLSTILGPDAIADLVPRVVVQQAFERARSFIEGSRIVSLRSGAPEKTGEAKLDPALLVVGERGFVDLPIRFEGKRRPADFSLRMFQAVEHAKIIVVEKSRFSPPTAH